MRNHLVKGFTAYAASGLGMDEPKVLRAITTLHCSSAAPHAEEELTAWLTAARRTLQRHAHGERVAWHPYYNAAGVTPPAPVGSSLALEARRAALQRHAAELSFLGRTGLTDRALYEALVELALQHGGLDARGLAVRVSRRDLASRANLSDNGAMNALKRLRARGLVQIPSQRRQPGQAGSIVLTIEVNAKQRTQSTPKPIELPTEQEWVRCFAHVAFRRGSLGPIAALIVAQLQQGGAAGVSVRVLAKRLERAPWRLKHPIDRLVFYGVIEAVESGRLLRLTADFEARLDVAAEQTGAVRARARQKERHEVERTAYRETYGLPHPSRPS